MPKPHDIESKKFGVLPSFHLTSQQCQLLVALQNSRSLMELGKTVGRDPSVVSRQLRQIASLAPVLEKRQGVWVLTEVGNEVVRWTREAAFGQGKILSQKGEIRLAASRELIHRIVAPCLKKILPANESLERLAVIATGGRIESLILSGEIDLGLEYGKPLEPNIRSLRLGNESLARVAAPKLAEKFRSDPPGDTYLHWSSQITPPADGEKAVFRSNDSNLIREACVSGLGWTILPRWFIETDLANRTLVEIAGAPLLDLPLGLWWLSDRLFPSKEIPKIIGLLKRSFRSETEERLAIINPITPN